MLVHALMAGGIGSRLYGPDGGLKPLEPVGAARVLIDYILDEGKSLGSDLYLVAIGSEGQPIVDHVRAAVTADVRPVRQSFPGTGGAVAKLLEESPEGANVFLTTSDLHGELGEIAAALGDAAGQLATDAPVCILAISPWIESDAAPIFVHTDPGEDGQPSLVTSYGKDVAPSSMVFSGARLLNAAFGRLFVQLVNSSDRDLTDTQLMKRAVAAGARILAVPTLSVFDVDDQPALSLARADYQARSARP